MGPGSGLAFRAAIADEFRRHLVDLRSGHAAKIYEFQHREWENGWVETFKDVISEY